ncbi:hypothetical protein MTsPCn5_19070 [Croceitalea sp. MTPC5]|uniref:Crp/Fnr family transcriptional regulator n=1 Tax=Croceitalea sp. MTPC5 TaxID=3056565 RepID=UPI002B3EE886|nr:hypothetical protein MTsPCn5_19070 [Croceitalea sp. MTPC5]
MIRVNKEFLEYVTTLKDSNGLSAITEQEASVGEKIVTEKTTVFSVYVVKAGLAKCYLTEDTGKDFIQEFFGAGEVFGELEMFTHDFSFCTIEALTPIEYYKIPKAAFLDLINNDSKFNSLVLKLLASKIRYTALRHSYHQSHALEVNLKRLLKEFPDLLQKISKKDIANYLGVTLRSLNRAIKILG